jgi:hypothetical protein
MRLRRLLLVLLLLILLLLLLLRRACSHHLGARCAPLASVGNTRTTISAATRGTRGSIIHDIAPAYRRHLTS